MLTRGKHAWASLCMKPGAGGVEQAGGDALAGEHLVEDLTPLTSGHNSGRIVAQLDRPGPGQRVQA